MYFFKKCRVFFEKTGTLFTNAVRYHRFINSPYVHYKIVGEDCRKSKMYFSCFGLRTVLTCETADAISNIDIINNLTPAEACYLGFRYTELTKNKEFSVNFSFVLQSEGRLILQYEDQRRGIVGYRDSITGDLIEEKPQELAKDYELLKSFNPAQAYYIGLLAGRNISREKRTKKVKNNNYVKPFMRLVR